MTILINGTGHYTLPSTWSHIRFYVFMGISVVQAFHIYVCIVFFFWLVSRQNLLLIFMFIGVQIIY